MACFATPYGLRYAAHCFNRAYAQQSCPALIPAGGKLGVTSGLAETFAGIDQPVDLPVLTNEFTQVGFHDSFIDCLRHFSILTHCDEMNVPICRPIIESSIIELCDKKI